MFRSYDQEILRFPYHTSWKILIAHGSWRRIPSTVLKCFCGARLFTNKERWETGDIKWRKEIPITCHLLHITYYLPSIIHQMIINQSINRLSMVSCSQRMTQGSADGRGATPARALSPAISFEPWIMNHSRLICNQLIKVQGGSRYVEG